MVADECGEAELEELGEGTGFGVDYVGGADAVEAADYAGEVLVEEALKYVFFWLERIISEAAANE